MKVIFIPVDIEVAICELDVDDSLQALQELVGGRVEASVPFPGRQDVTPMYNEEGKFLGLPFNARATALLASVMCAGDFIVGDCILTGFDQVRGRSIDCPIGVEDLAVPA